MQFPPAENTHLYGKSFWWYSKITSIHITSNIKYFYHSTPSMAHTIPCKRGFAVFQMCDKEHIVSFYFWGVKMFRIFIHLIFIFSWLRILALTEYVRIVIWHFSILNTCIPNLFNLLIIVIMQSEYKYENKLKITSF